VSGRCGETEFGWEHTLARSAFTITDMEQIAQNVTESFQRLELFEGTSNRRLLAAAQYCFVASRLLVAGESPWEFMSEFVLNMSKCLEVLFGDRDGIRSQLSVLGYSEEEIEGDFIPITLLRAQFDVAHPRLAEPRAEQLAVLYRYLTQSEARLRMLLSRVLLRVAAGTYVILPADEIYLGEGEQKRFDLLIESITTRIGTQPDEHNIL